VVDLTSHWNGAQRTCARSGWCRTRSRAAARPRYYPECNPLVPIDSVAERSNTRASKYVIVTVAPSAAPGPGGKKT
jgi:hypothetical protein